MHTSNVRNVCQALPATIIHLFDHGVEEHSRAGRVLVAPWPITTVTQKPRERVLFSSVRDANPFLMVYEAIWMLAGKRDADPLNKFVKDFGRHYGEDDGTVHGAYGHRWRIAFGFDQLNAVVKKLIEDPQDRQAVIQIWDCRMEGENDLLGTWKDRPCNDIIFLRIRDDELDLTVCCRSNDMLWGCHNTNQAHFSILQEYLAARIDVDMGRMYQFSHNAHIYLTELDRMRKRAGEQHLATALIDDRYSLQGIKPLPMFEEPTKIDRDIRAFMSGTQRGFYNPWFETTLIPMMHAHYFFKEGDHLQALAYTEQIEALDWRAACAEWIERRMQKRTTDNAA